MCSTRVDNSPNSSIEYHRRQQYNPHRWQLHFLQFAFNNNTNNNNNNNNNKYNIINNNHNIKIINIIIIINNKKVQPTITYIEPTSGNATGGTDVFLYGTNFYDSGEIVCRFDFNIFFFIH